MGELVVEASPSTSPTEEPVWEDISEFVERYSFSRGRESQLEKFEAGSLELTVVDEERQLDPTYPSGMGLGLRTRCRIMRRFRPRFSKYVAASGGILEFETDHPIEQELDGYRTVRFGGFRSDLKWSQFEATEGVLDFDSPGDYDKVVDEAEARDQDVCFTLDYAPAWAQPDNVYDTGSIVSHDGQFWVSDVDDNLSEPGVADWTTIDEFIPLTTSALSGEMYHWDLQVWLCVNDTTATPSDSDPDWLGLPTEIWVDPADPIDDKYPPAGPIRRQQMADSAGAAAARYKARNPGVVKAWEIWNEPNLGSQFWKPYADPVAYSDLVKRCSIAIKAADPDAIVLAGALAGAPTDGVDMEPGEFLDVMIDEGVLDYVDAISVHSYVFDDDLDFVFEGWKFPNNSGSWFGETNSMRSKLVAAGFPEMPIWVTEVNINGVDEATRASQTEAVLDRLASYDYVEVVAWYTWQVSGDDRSLVGGGPSYTPTATHDVIAGWLDDHELGELLPRYEGYFDALPPSAEVMPRSTLQASDGMHPLNRLKLPDIPEYDSLVSFLESAVLYYWPLTETGEGSISFEDLVSGKGGQGSPSKGVLPGAIVAEPLRGGVEGAPIVLPAAGASGNLGAELNPYSDWTVECWLIPTGSTGGDIIRGPRGQDGPGTIYQYHLSMDSSRQLRGRAAVGTAPGPVGVAMDTGFGAALTIGQLYHVMLELSHDPGADLFTLAIYLDNVLYDSTTSSTAGAATQFTQGPFDAAAAAQLLGPTVPSVALHRVAIYRDAIADRAQVHIDNAESGFPEQGTGERVDAILDLLGAWTAERLVDAGTVDVTARGLRGQTALSELRLVEESEDGPFFVDAAGREVFLPRTWRDDPPRDVPLYTFGNTASGQLPVAAPATPYDDTDLVNKWTVSNEVEGDNAQTAEDATSIGAHFETSQDRSTLLTSEAACEALADHLLARTANPPPDGRCVGFTTNPHESPEVARAIASIELTDRILLSLARRVGDPLEQESFIERITETGEKGKWTCDFAISEK